jgi:hypothetical protein
MGLEPTTFCMARTLPETTRCDTSRQGALLSQFRERPSDSNRQQPTCKAD